MIPQREAQDKRITTPADAIAIRTWAEITARRLCQFLDETLGVGRWRKALDAWIEIVVSTHDRQFVDNLRRAFPGIPLDTSDTVHAFCSRRDPRLLIVACGHLTIFFVVGPRNDAADQCVFLPLWTASGATPNPPTWLYAFDVDGVICALEGLLGRYVRWPC
jgi:hypothetical protein